MTKRRRLVQRCAASDDAAADGVATGGGADSVRVQFPSSDSSLSVHVRVPAGTSSGARPARSTVAGASLVTLTVTGWPGQSRAPATLTRSALTAWSDNSSRLPPSTVASTGFRPLPVYGPAASLPFSLAA